MGIVLDKTRSQLRNNVGGNLVGAGYGPGMAEMLHWH